MRNRAARRTNKKSSTRLQAAEEHIHIGERQSAVGATTVRVVLRAWREALHAGEQRGRARAQPKLLRHEQRFARGDAPAVADVLRRVVQPAVGRVARDREGQQVRHGRGMEHWRHGHRGKCTAGSLEQSVCRLVSEMSDDEFCEYHQ